MANPLIQFQSGVWFVLKHISEELKLPKLLVFVKYNSSRMGMPWLYDYAGFIEISVQRGTARLHEPTHWLPEYTTAEGRLAALNELQAHENSVRTRFFYPPIPLYLNNDSCLILEKILNDTIQIYSPNRIKQNCDISASRLYPKIESEWGTLCEKYHVSISPTI